MWAIAGYSSDKYLIELLCRDVIWGFNQIIVKPPGRRDGRSCDEVVRPGDEVVPVRVATRTEIAAMRRRIYSWPAGGAIIGF
jgi:hypothetical protein